MDFIPNNNDITSSAYGINYFIFTNNKMIDPRKENIAVLEARKLNIPIVATVDTNCDPDVIDHVIPANDDAIRAVKLLTAKMADAVLEGRQGMQMEEAAEVEEVAAEDAE